MRRWLLALGCSLAVLAPTATAQVPERARDLRWHTFVGGTTVDSQRTQVDDSPGRIDMGESPWSCGFARTRYAGVGQNDWSVQRVLACRRGDATVSSTAWCRREGTRLQEHAATLSLGTYGQSDHVTVTLSCDPPP